MSVARCVAIHAAAILRDGGVLVFRVGHGLLDAFVAGDAELTRRLLDEHGLVTGVGVVATDAIGPHGLVYERDGLELLVHLQVATDAKLTAGFDEQLGVLRGVGFVTHAASAGGDGAVDELFVADDVLVTGGAQVAHGFGFE
jgi:hypothetical protein